MDAPDVPRIRTLKPEHKVHRKVGPLSDREYRLWVGLITESDDHGRFVADPEQLKVTIFPYQPRLTTGSVEQALGALEGRGLIQRYDVDGTCYGVFPSWVDHQKVAHPGDSKIPEPSGVLVKAHEDSCLARARGSDQGSGIKDRIRDQGSGNVSRAERRETACRLIDFLNEKAGKSFRKVDASLEPIMARLAEGATEANGRGVIARKVREWSADPKMAKYLRPETLFNRTKFEGYLGERSPERAADA